MKSVVHLFPGRGAAYSLIFPSYFLLIELILLTEYLRPGHRFLVAFLKEFSVRLACPCSLSVPLLNYITNPWFFLSIAGFPLQIIISNSSLPNLVGLDWNHKRFEWLSDFHDWSIYYFTFVLQFYINLLNLLSGLNRRTTHFICLAPLWYQFGNNSNLWTFFRLSNCPCREKKWLLHPLQRLQ